MDGVPQNLYTTQGIRPHGYIVLYLAYRLNYLFHFFHSIFFQNIAIGYSFTEIKKIIDCTLYFDAIDPKGKIIYVESRALHVPLRGILIASKNQQPPFTTPLTFTITAYSQFVEFDR